MDKKNAIFGFILLLVAFGLFAFGFQRQAERERVARENAPATPPPAETASQGRADPTSEEEVPLIGPAPEEGAPAFLRPAGSTPDAGEEVAPPEGEETTYVLENDLLRLTFTSRGGALRAAAFKDYSETDGSEEPYVFNDEAPRPALVLARKGASGRLVPFSQPFELVEQTAERIVFRRSLADGVELTRTYSILPHTAEGAEPYLVQHRTKLLNLSEQAFTIEELYLSLGTISPVPSDPAGYQINFVRGFAGDTESVHGRDFSPYSGMPVFGWGARGPKADRFENAPADWGAIKNHFFAAVFTPEGQQASSFFAGGVSLPPQPWNRTGQRGLTASLGFELGTIESGGGQRVLAGTYYVGPKEYPRLSKLDEGQDAIMQFGWLGFISKLFLHLLLAIQSFVHNYGMAIVLLTIALRLLFWPLTAKAADNARKMQKLQEPMKEIREKYKDNPQKQQKETLKLFQEHKVNPVAGCLPMLIQMPIFIGFFYMLRNAAELRFEDFLWIADLSQPDTVARFGGLPLNPMPILMAITMFVQMRVAAPPSMDPMQKRLFQFMPFMMLLFLYNFASGLALYWTTSNLFSIGQQMVINRRREREEAAEAAAGKGGAIDVKAESVSENPLIKKKPKRDKLAKKRARGH